ncbi:unnamed protein product, partial [Anisakis simplex]|uniref:BBE domain-containing protein n=1 Tax=Anisakis simplex TaxID=6269 RepID=A0A0M3JMK0_ANISI
MVPTDRPGPALQMYQDFLRNTNYSMPVTVSTKRVPLK